MELNYVLIGTRIRQYREDKSLSQEELADNAGISWRHLNYVEHGERKISVDVLIALANALDATADDLLADHLNGSNTTLKEEAIDLLHDSTPPQKKLSSWICSDT
ncbi:MAG: helix-turn-helix transcriptional regulator [Oscillospiraceae bacterium]|nr:helix-turn-helix transcriptional regulator [Oscillospiraceae bacterium]